MYKRNTEGLLDTQQAQCAQQDLVQNVNHVLAKAAAFVSMLLDHLQTNIAGYTNDNGTVTACTAGAGIDLHMCCRDCSICAL